MVANSYYEIGYDHKVCEDYSLSGQKDSLLYTVLSDGCSSSENSDVGARLLCHIAKGIILYLNDRGVNIFNAQEYQTIFKELLIRKCLEVKQSLGTSIDTFDATLLASIIKDGYALNMAWGDGYLVKIKKGMGIETTEIKYTTGAPYYLS